MDTLSPEARSKLMSRIRGKDTAPELVLRRFLHAGGYRYRLHDRRLPGRPDIVFPARRKIIFMHGCFWHRHDGCRLASIPKSRVDFWTTKFRTNVERDARNEVDLAARGWKVMVVWECEVRHLAELGPRLVGFLGPSARMETVGEPSPPPKDQLVARF